MEEEKGYRLGFLIPAYPRSTPFWTVGDTSILGNSYMTPLVGVLTIFDRL